MGQDKAFLRLGGCTLLERALELVRGLAGNAWIVGNKGKFAAFGPVVEDLYPGMGPLGGIHAALTKTSTDLNLMIAVDLPFVQAGFPELSDCPGPRNRSRGRGAKSRRRPATIVCSLPPRFAEAAERSLRAGKTRSTVCLPNSQTRVIDQEELMQRRIFRRRCSAT